ncbi:hypothetical protein PHYPSEUDO_009678 [Phytophthora pseudosyringae]|uniref:Uncharacterized protein n=1 Tax=Phytophthora pseudosyringae TaxID=221518 RepID=A0A8T1WAK1_9STRA|nr:hypothetical protein PHYPSEUDO_009678 [Phytophthora pseudosyringae]
MAGRGRGRANTLPAWMTKQGVNGPPPPGPAPGSRPPPSAGACPPPPPPPGHSGQFDDAPEPLMRNDTAGKRRSRSRDRGNGRNGGDVRGPPPVQDRPRSRSRGRGNGRDRGYGYDADRRREDSHRRGLPRGRSRSRSRERRTDYRGDYRRGGGDRNEDRGYGSRGPRDDDYRRNDGRPVRREEEAAERGYRRPASNGHDDRTSRRYVSDYQP